MRNRKIKNEIDEIKKWENKIKRKDLKYERYICIYYYIYIIYIIYIYIYIYILLLLLNAPDILLFEHSHKLCIANIIDTLHGIWKLRTLDTH